MRTNPLVFALLGLGGLVLALTNGCSSSDSNSNTAPPPCNTNPWSCPDGQTCWIMNQAGSFSCLNSDATKVKGAECLNIMGQATCGDDMICFQLQGQAKGVCAPYCDNTIPSRGCDTGETCTTLILGSSTASACRPAATPPDAGADAQEQETGADAEAETGGEDAQVEAAADVAADVPEGGTLPDE